MPDLYTIVGGFVSKGLAQALEGQTVEVAHIGQCNVEGVREPHLHDGNWSFDFDLKLPNSDSSFTLAVFTFGSCLLPDIQQFTFPAPQYEDKLDERFPPDHQAAWCNLLDSLESEL